MNKNYRATFAWVTMVYEFTSEEEMDEFIRNRKSKKVSRVVSKGECGKDMWSCTIEKPYMGYEMG